ncbi:hypothetical protein [Guptibacillus hwajinpoensis]|uniref:DUF4352 domain-containing protein n=1 Tax=Guptibacillus hwajinpoensis TaxID=208199 RepID=A0ABU0JVH3_9BACL|nr:hypothetical protein [Alkalihalobacillus hemicentroti]MDQ0481098.1 hypothetical protein [Alkalihalobacillus hemicentroti]
MRKSLVLLFMGAILVLGACGSNESQGNTSTNANSSANDSNEEVKQEEPKDEAAEDDGNDTLDTIGEIEENEGVKAKLLGLWNEGQPVHEGDFGVTLNSVKLIELQEIDEEFKQGIMMMTSTDELETPAQYLQVEYTVQNNTDTAVWWNDIDQILFGKKQIDVMMNDFIMTNDEPTDTILSGTEYNGTVGVLVSNPDADNVKLSFSDVYTEEGMDTVAKTKEVDLTLNK